jgi:prepilin-type N-terminal cleavage/methylation domain-containing protein
MRRGYTLVESIAVLVIVGILCGIAAPHLTRMLDSAAVTEAANHIVAAHRRARIAAIMRGGVTVLTIDSTAIVIRPRDDTTTLWREAGPVALGVTLVGPARTVMFSPVGLALGVSNATYTVTRRDARRAVVVSRLGRVRVTP